MLGDDHELIEIGLPDLVQIVAELLRSGIQVRKENPVLLSGSLILITRGRVDFDRRILFVSRPAEDHLPVISGENEIVDLRLSDETLGTKR